MARQLQLVPSLEANDGLCAYAAALSGDSAQLIALMPDQATPADCLALVLHYSGYGYAANGAPEVLLRQCALWRAGQPQRRLLVVFHELFARQPPWRKGFWLAPLQRRLLRRLIALCDGGLSTLELHSRWLRRNGLEPFATLPVPSNVGEIAEPLPLVARDRSLVIFGGRSQRQMAYAALARQPALLQRLGIQGLHDIGPSLDLPPSLTGLPIRQHGLLPAEDVSALLASAQVAAVSYPLPFLAKSGIFAALCAHGTLPLVLNAGRCLQADGLRPGHSFITPAWLQAGCDLASAESQAIATAAWRWYQPHRLAEQRRIVAAWIASAA